MLNKIFRKIPHLFVRVQIRMCEKKFYGNGHTLRYLYFPSSRSKVLAVIFSAFPGQGKKAGYNLVSTLNGVAVNRLYLLDNFGYQGRGSYYLGENGDMFLPPMVDEVIRKYSAGMDKRAFIGSSKGGTAALLYGIRLMADEVIMGAPQYYIGAYLTEKQDHIPLMKGVAGNCSNGQIERLDDLLPNLIRQSALSDKKPLMVLHYSKEEPTYPLHIHPMVDDLTANGFSIEEDIESYTDHISVASYFPQLVKKRLIFD